MEKNSYEKDVKSALCAFWSQSGSGRFTSDDIVDEIKSEIVSPDIENRLVKSFNEKMDIQMEISACAVCGMC